MFRLSNKSVQVDFKDKTEIMLSTDSKLVIYANKLGEKSTYPISSALESTNHEMTKRLKYTKNLLNQLLATVPRDALPTNSRFGLSPPVGTLSSASVS